MASKPASPTNAAAPGEGTARYRLSMEAKTLALGSGDATVIESDVMLALLE